MSSYLDCALKHEPLALFTSVQMNNTAEFFASRAKFSLAIVEKTADLVASLFKLLVVEALPALVNYENGRERFSKTISAARDSGLDITVGIAGVIFGKEGASDWNNKIRGPKNQSA